MQDEVADFLVDSWYFDVARKHAAVHIRKCCEFFVHVRVTVFGLDVQHAEQLYQPHSEIGSRKLRHVVVKHALAPENARVLGIEAKHQAHAKFVESLLRFKAFGVFVLRQNLVVQHTDNLARLDADLQLLLDVSVGIIDQESQTMIFILQIRQLDDFGRIVGTLHVVYLESGEIAGHNPARSHRKRQTRGIAAGLLVRCKFRTVRLFGFGRKVNMRAFLLNQHLGWSDVAVNEIRSLLLGDGFDGNLELHRFGRVVHSKDIVEQVQPKALGFAFLVAFAHPILDELLGCLFLYHV